MFVLLFSASIWAMNCMLALLWSMSAMATGMSVYPLPVGKMKPVMISMKNGMRNRKISPMRFRSNSSRSFMAMR